MPKPTFTPSLTLTFALFLFQEWTPDKKHKKGKKKVEQKAAMMERRSVYYFDICCGALTAQGCPSVIHKPDLDWPCYCLLLCIEPLLSSAALVTDV